MSHDNKAVQYTSRSADKFVVRLPEGMRERISDVSKENHRSMNSEIIARLETSLEEDLKKGPVKDERDVQVVTLAAPWIPQIGMLVKPKPEFAVTGKEIFGINNFDINVDGELIAELKGLDNKETLMLVSWLMPYYAQ